MSNDFAPRQPPGRKLLKAPPTTPQPGLQPANMFVYLGWTAPPAAPAAPADWTSD